MNRKTMRNKFIGVHAAGPQFDEKAFYNVPELGSRGSMVKICDEQRPDMHILRVATNSLGSLRAGLTC
jgi:hypothetical protein